MILVECPYCDEKINILFREEIENLINKGFLDCECDYCRQVFEIYQEKERYEAKTKKMMPMKLKFYLQKGR